MESLTLVNMIMRLSQQGERRVVARFGVRNITDIAVAIA